MCVDGTDFKEPGEEAGHRWRLASHRELKSTQNTAEQPQLLTLPFCFFAEPNRSRARRSSVTKQRSEEAAEAALEHGQFFEFSSALKIK